MAPTTTTEEDWHIAAAQGRKAIRSLDEAARSAEKDKLKGEIKDLLEPIETIMGKGVDNVTKIR